MRTKNLLYSWFLIMLFCMMGTSSAWADDVTYTFTSKAWDDSESAWTSGKDGNQFQGGRGVQVTAGVSGANATSVYEFTKISKIVVTYSTNASKGAGDVSIQVGSNEASSQSVTKTGGTSDRTLEYVYDTPQTGVVNITVTCSENSIYIKSIAITLDSGGDTPTLDDNDLALTGAPVELEFDLYNNASAQVINYTTSSTGAVTIDDSDYATFDIDEENKTITVTPTAVTPNVVTITVNQAADDSYKAGSTTFDLLVDDSTPIPTHTATFSVNGVTSTQDFEEGADIDFPENPANINGKTFVGWVAEAIEGTTNDAPTFVTSATMGQSDITYYAVFAYVDGASEAGSVELTPETDGVPASYGTANTFSEYTFGGVKFQIMQMYKNSGKLQWRAAGNSNGTGTMYNSESLGKIESVVLTYNSSDANNNFTLKIGDSENPTDGEAITPSSNGSVYTFDCSSYNYDFFVLANGSGAGYLDKLVINYTIGSSTISDYCTTVVAAAVERPTIEVAANPFTFSTTATITCETEGAAIKYSFDGENWNDYEDALTITETTTLYAKAVKEEAESTVASVEITKNLAVPTVAIDATGITNTNVFDGTEAGSLAASVTYNEAAVEGAAITWSGNNDEVATIDASTGVVTLVAAGSVTFTATYAGNSDYAEKTATYQMTVTNSDPNGPGTENNPYTVSQITKTENGVYVQGIISSITEVSTSYHNATYKISEDGTTTNEFTVFRGRYLDNTDFTSADQIAVGDAVVIYGNITTYNEQLQLGQGNYLVSLDHAEKHALNFAVSPADAGTIEGLDGEANEVNSGDKFDENATITLSATANTGYTFTNWTAEGFEINGEDAVKTDLDITMPANDVTLTANFSVNTYALDITSTNGTVAVTVNGEAWNGTDAIAYGSTVELTATSNENWAFSSWTAEGINFEDATLNPISFTMPANEVMIEANYADASATYTVIYVVNGVDDSVERKHGDPLNLDAPTLPATTPETAMIFAGWSTSDDLANPTIMANDAPVTSDLIVYAMFTAQQGQTVYQKVTEGPVEDGEYLIVYETEDVAFDGSLTTLDAGANIISLEDVRISDETIASTTTTNASAFTIAALEEGYSIQSQSGYYIGQTSNANGMATSEETVYTNAISIDSNGDADIVSGGAYLRYNSAANQTRFRYYKSSSYGGQKAIQLYKKVTTNNLYTFGETEEITVSAAGYATYCSDKALDFSHTPDLKAYIVTSDGSETNYTEVTTAPANTGLLLKGIKGEATNFTAYVIGNSDTYVADNKLVGVNENTHIDATTEGKTNFVLQNQVKYGVGFYKVTGEGFNVRANSAYLSVELSSGSEARSFFALPEAGSETTGINSIDNGQLTIDNEAVYDLQGRKVQNPKRGLYIMNGKKVMVK